MFDSLWGNIFKMSKDETDSDLHLLAGIPILEGLSANELKEFERIVHHRNFKANEHIFWEGEPGVGMYIIKKGSVKIYRKLSEGHDKELAILKIGDFFGEMALLDESPRSASAVAVEESQLLGIYQPELFDVFERAPKIGLKVPVKLAKIIGMRLRKTNEQLQQLLKESVKSTGS